MGQQTEQGAGCGGAGGGKESVLLDLELGAQWPGYAYLDSGDGRRLERFGTVLLDRPAPQALWPRRLSPARWAEADARYLRRPDGGGDWIFAHGELPPWTVAWEGIRFEAKLTGFGHLGLFPEQMPNWQWLQERFARREAPSALLNLFAYTGAASLAAAHGGAAVTHLDAVKGVVQWASDNARSDPAVEGRVRWIVDDASRFVARELRRGRRYDGIVLDPPTFGRGSQGQVWKLEEDLARLLAECFLLLSEDPELLLLSTHTPGVTPAVLRNLLRPLHQARGGLLQAGEMLLVSRESPHVLPSGAYCRWTPGAP